VKNQVYGGAVGEVKFRRAAPVLQDEFSAPDLELIRKLAALRDFKR